MSGLDATPARDVGGELERCRGRLLEREGIAMFVALHDARPGRSLTVTDAVAVVEGRRLADLVDHYERGLAARASSPDPDQPDPTGAREVIDLLVVLSDLHLRVPS